ncbi:MAG: hypothetical protein AAGG08_06030, partial [Actinomycetota bacterium]
GTLTATLYRPADQLRLRFEFVNLAHDAGGDRLVGNGAGPALLRITYPRQHVSEQPVRVGDTPPGAASAPIDHAVAAASRLVFAVTPPLDLTVASLLDLASFALVTTTAQADPDDDTTMIEVPADLRWSPGANVTALADAAPSAHFGTAELHRTRLEGPGASFEFTPVHNASNADGFDRRVPNRAARDSIVAAASANGPATAHQLMLTPFGAWADLEGNWPGTSWIQRVQGGRDQFAQVVDTGTLLPFGLPALWTETSTRVWVADADGDTVSTMVFETHFAVAGDATIDPSGTVQAFAGRLQPLRSVTAQGPESVVVEKSTIEVPGQFSINDDNAWIVAHAAGTPDAGDPVRVSYSATDHDGEISSFTLPAVFVRAGALSNHTLVDRLAEFYASDAGVDHRTVEIDGNLAWAERTSPTDPTTSFHTRQLELEFEPVDPAAALAVGELPIKPITRGGRVAPPFGEGEVDVVFPQRFVDHGLDPAENPSLAFLELPTPQDIPFGAEARAVMTPDGTAEEFNLTTGIGEIVDDPTSGGTWSPEDAFGAAAQILRGITLSDLVDPISLDLAVPGIDIPTLTTVVTPRGLEQSYTWCPTTIKSVPALGFETTADTTLCVEARSTVGIGVNGESGVEVEFALTDVEFHIPPLVPLIVFDVAEISAIQPSTGPVDLTLDIRDWRLGGDLTWLQTLFDRLTPAGRGFDIDVDARQIDAHLPLSIPGVSLGVLTIDSFDVSLDASFPYVGSEPPLIGIDIGSKRDPIRIQLLQFAGTFRLGVAFDTTGLRELEVYAGVSARLVSIDIVIAEAYCEVGLSAEFTLRSDGTTKFTGTVWLTAHFSVAGLIGATLTIEGSLSYEPALERLRLRGVIHWSATAVFTFSGRVPLGTTDFEIGNSSGDQQVFGALATPGGDRGGGFGEAHTFATWTDYVSKFAAA